MNLKLEKTSPAQRLPFDVLWYLFRYVVVVDGDEGPTTISHACRLWRQSALDTPFLWTKITIRLYFYEQKHRRAKARFKRSGNLPLDITFHCSRNLQESESESLVIPQAHRIRSLVVHCKGGTLSELLWMRLNLHMPRLEEFNTVISRHPGLHAVRKISSHEDLTSLVPFVPKTCRPTDWQKWSPSGLTSVELATTAFFTELSLLDLHSVLANTANTLQQFGYEGYGPSYNPLQHYPPPVDFPELRKLTVSFFDEINPFLSIFDIPSLDSLTLRNFIACPAHSIIRDIPPGSAKTDILFGLLPIIGKWNTITHLELFAIDELPLQQTLSYIRSLSGLESAILYGMGGPECFAQALFRNPIDNGPLLPKLKRLLCTPFNSGLDIVSFLFSRRMYKLPVLETLSITANLLSLLVEQDSLSILKDAALVVKVIDNPVLYEHVLVNEVHFLTNEHLLQQPSIVSDYP